MVSIYPLFPPLIFIAELLSTITQKTYKDIHLNQKSLLITMCRPTKLGIGSNNYNSITGSDIVINGKES